METKAEINKKHNFENMTESEMNCAFSLLHLKCHQDTGLLENNSQSSQNHFISKPTSVNHSIPENSLVGTKFGTFLSEFVARTPSSMPALAVFINLPLLQKGVETFSSGFLAGLDTCILSQKQMFRSFAERFSGIHDPAVLAYFLVAIRLGSLQSGDYQPDNQETYYQAIDLLLHPFYGEQRAEIILIHFLLCLFAKLISKNPEAEKHGGFAQVLLSTLLASNVRVDEGLKRAGGMTIDGLKVPLYSIIGVEHKVVEILLAHFTIGVEVFQNLFPCLASFMDSQYKKAVFDENRKYERILHGLVQLSPAHTIPLITARHFQNITSTDDLSKLQVTNSLIEMVQFCNFVVKHSSLCIEALPPLIRGYILQIDCLKFLFEGDTKTAKLLLASILDGLDFYTLQNGYFWFGGQCSMVHQLHLVLAAAAILKMESEYYCLRERLKPIFFFSQHQFPLPRSLSGLCRNESVSLCACPNKSAKCDVLTLFGKLEAMCTDNEMETTP